MKCSLQCHLLTINFKIKFGYCLLRFCSLCIMLTILSYTKCDNKFSKNIYIYKLYIHTKKAIHSCVADTALLSKISKDAGSDNKQIIADQAAPE